MWSRLLTLILLAMAFNCCEQDSADIKSSESGSVYPARPFRKLSGEIEGVRAIYLNYVIKPDPAGCKFVYWQKASPTHELVLPISRPGGAAYTVKGNEIFISGATRSGSGILIVIRKDPSTAQYHLVWRMTCIEDITGVAFSDHTSRLYLLLANGPLVYAPYSPGGKKKITTDDLIKIAGVKDYPSDEYASYGCLAINDGAEPRLWVCHYTDLDYEVEPIVFVQHLASSSAKEEPKVWIED